MIKLKVVLNYGSTIEKKFNDTSEAMEYMRELAENGNEVYEYQIDALVDEELESKLNYADMASELMSKIYH